jgi:hypothetical protein
MPKVKMPNFKEFDFKKFLLEKGERVALWAMVGIMALLIVMGVFVNGFSKGSASGNSSDINKLSEACKNALGNSQPNEEIKVIKREYLQAAAMPQLDLELLFLGHALFSSADSVDRRWRKPEVLRPDEFQTVLLRGLVETYVPAVKNGQPAVMYIPGGKGSGKMEPGARQAGPAMRGPNTNNFRGIMNMPGGMPANRFFGGMVPPGMRNAQPGMGMNGPPGLEEGAVKMYAVPIDQVGTPEAAKDGGKPAKAVAPMRIGVVHAAFPYRQQFEVFQHALRYNSIEEMEKDATVEFLGLEVQRREIGPDGKPTSEWKALDLIGPLRPFLAFGVEPEDPVLKAYGLVWSKDRLIIPRPYLARNQEYPTVDLPGIDKTVKAIEEAAKAAGPPPPIKQPNRFSKDFDFIEDEAVAGPNGNPMNPAFPMPRGPMPRGPMPEGPQRPAIAPGPGGPRNVMAAFGSQERLLPEKCLVRFLDVDLEPGKTYEYQMKIKMANPLFGKKDVAISQELIKNKEMESDWTLVTKRLTVPFEGDFYFLDDPTKPKATGADRTYVQIHRWCDWVPVNPAAPKESITGVGDWAIADQSAAVRGEYLGRWEEVEVAVWNPRTEEFLLAQHPDSYKRAGKRLTYVQHKGVAVDFNTGALLVDFDGGKADIFFRDKDRREVKVRDESFIEALVMTPEGKLMVRDARADFASKERIDLVKEVADRIRSVRDHGGTKGSGGKEDDIFNKTKKP